MSKYVKKNTGPSMAEVLTSEGWKKTLEGWIDPVMKDKVSLDAAWQRRLRRLTRSQSSVS